jgi:alanyl-tRNA synthetase
MQSIALLFTDKYKGHVRVFFVAGLRVVRALDQSCALERQITRVLSSGPEEHVARIEQSLKNERAQEKRARAFIKEIAELTGANLRAQVEARAQASGTNAVQPIIVHRDDGETEFCAVVAGCLDGAPALALLTTGTW